MTDENAGKSSEHAHMTTFVPFEAEKPKTLATKRQEAQDTDRRKALQDSNQIVIQEQDTDPPGSSRVLFKKYRPSGETVAGSSKPPANQTYFYSRLSSSSKPSNRADSFSVSYSASSNTVKSPSITMNEPAETHGTTGHTRNEQFSASVVVGGRPVTHVDDTQEDTWGADPQISLLSYSDVRKGRVHSRVAAGGSSGSKAVPPQQMHLQPPSRKPVNRADVETRIGIIEKHQESSDLKKYWMPDKSCKECSECGVKFNILVRKHHCRICGRIFCNSCCSCTIPGALLRPDLQGQLRVCKECLDIFNDYASRKAEQSHQVGEVQSSGSSPLVGRANTSSPNLEAPLTSSESTLTRGMSQRPINILTPLKSWDETSSIRSQEMLDASPRTSVLEFDNLYSTPRRTLSGGNRRESNFDSVHSVGPRDERLMALDEDEVEFIVSGVWYRFMEPGTGLQPQNHRLRLGLRNFPNTYSAHDIVVWLMSNQLARSHEVALRVGQALVDSKRLNIVSSPDPVFRDDTALFLELGEAAYLQPENPENPVVHDAPKWFQHLPHDRDSEHPYSSSDSSTAFFRKNQFLEPTVTISSLSDLEVTEMTADDSEKAAESEEDYLVIDKDSKITDQHSSLASSPSKDSEMPRFSVTPENSGTPVHSTPTSKYSPHSVRKYHTGADRAHSFTLLDSRELLSTVPVQHLRSATRSVDQDDANQSMVSATDAKVHFESEHDKHFDDLMIQLIMTLGLDLSWLQVIKPLIKEATNNVQTNVFDDDVMDINQYVKVKKIAGGHKGNSSLVYGVVCTKNVTHKKMQCSIKNPSILLLRCAFDFQRRENQLSSFDTLQLQEEKFLKNRVARVKTIDPNIVLVQNSVSRLALEMLYELGIVVVVNVRPSVMNRVARCTGVPILNSLDQLFFDDVRLGTCGHFYTRDFTLPDGVKKTLMYFDKCEPRLGCVITLHGGSNRELKRVKKLTQFGLHIAHNSRLETSFLVDEFAWPSPTSLGPKPELSLEDYSSSPSTPEWPLFPALPHPLDSLSPAELAEKLQALGFTSSKADDETAQRKLSDDASLSAISTGDVPSNQDEETSAQINGTVETKENEPDVTTDQPLEPPKDSAKGDSDATVSNVQGQQIVTTVEPPTPSAVSEAQRVDSGLLMTISEETVTESQVELDDEYEEHNAVKASQIVSTVSQETLVHLAEKEFQKAIDSQVLSISPNVQFDVPYLQTAQGRETDVRQYLPREIYWSYQFRKKAFEQKMLRSLGYLETGTTRDVQLYNAEETEHPVDPELQYSPVSQRSYKSVADHPLTKSIFLLKANTNEMKAALADYRARAGQIEEDDSFFFPSAQRASNYHLQLQTVFNKYKQFEEDVDSLEESTSLENSTEDSSKHESTANTKARGQFWRRDHKKGTPKTKQGKQKLAASSEHAQLESSSGHSQQVAEEVDSEIRAEDAKAATEPTVTTKESQTLLKSSETEMTDSGSRSKREKSSERSFSSTGSAKEASDNSHKTTSSRISKDSSGFRLSAGILEDIDRSPLRDGRDGEDDGNNDMDMNYMYDMWMANDTHADCLDPYNHQAISILFSNTCHDGQKHQTPCVSPCVIRMFYYGQNDISLGEFLQRYCFRERYVCQSCGVEMSKHQRHIVHKSTAIHITMQQLDGALPDNDNGIYTWLACKHCSQCTPPTLMSGTSLLFSFAKFLELKLHCFSYITRYESNETNEGCQHLLHSDYVQYFCHRNKIAAFQPSDISILEVLLPPRDIFITTPHDKYHLNYVADIKDVLRVMEAVFYRITQKLLKYNMEPVTSLVNDHIANCKAEREALRVKGNNLKALVVSAGFLMSGIPSDGQDAVTKQEREDEMLGTLLDGLEDYKRSISEVVECWNINLEDVDFRVREYRRKLREANISPYAVEGPSRSPRDSPVSTATGNSNSKELNIREDHFTTPVSASKFSNSSPSLKRDSTEPSSQSQNQYLDAHSTLKSNTQSHSRNLSDSSYEMKSKKVHQRKLSDSNAMQTSFKESSSASGEDAKRDKMAASEHTAVLSGTTSTDMSTKESLEDPLGTTSTIPSSEGETNNGGETTDTAATVASKDDIASASYFTPDEEGTHTTDSSGGLFAKIRDFGRDDTREDTPKFYHLDQNEIRQATGSPKLTRAVNANPSDHTPPTKVYHKRPGTVPRKTLTSVVNTSEGNSEGKGERRANRKENGVLARPFQRLPPPFEPTEHHTMSQHLTIPVAIYEKEPTSIIAFALSSREYAKELKTLMERVVMKRFASAPSGFPEVKPAMSTSPKAKRRGNDTEKPQASHTGNTLKSQAALNFRAALHELKKKSSAISLFSGLTMSNTSGGSDTVEAKVDPFTQSHEPKLESSSSSHKSREGAQFSKSGDATLDGGGLHPNASAGSHIDEVDASKTSGHISLEFTTPDKSASFFCKVYFAEEFHKLRERIFPSGEDRYIRSLARCVKYDAKGGKSRSAFCKVADDRFILKQIKSIEISAFEQFATHYLEHVTKALEEKRPLALAKILGAYSIGFKNSKTGNSKRLDVLVMENLLYGHSTAKVFDLKGSMRSRYIDPSKDTSGDTQSVLLDENYLNYICNNPVYVYPHSKFVLMQAVLADSEFLARNSIMDYSLLTCIDESSGELVVGIIDYVRTFTLDKWLEMKVKKTAGRTLPTVVYPELYRKRFCDAIERYFTPVPDKWTGLGSGIGNMLV